MTFAATILTLYPEMFPGPLGVSLAGRAREEGKWSLEAVQIRDFAVGKHHTVDDTPAGGGAGMVLRADVLGAAIDFALAQILPGTGRGTSEAGGGAQAGGPDPAMSGSTYVPLHHPADGPPPRHGEERPILAMTPRGTPLSQARVRQLSAGPGVIVLCGRFEGFDERIFAARGVEEVSVGDIVLSGGEPAAIMLLDACIRLLPGVMGAASSGIEESFEQGLLEYPHYTRPVEWEGRTIPEVLRSGDHAKIAGWRKTQSEIDTRLRRPDLWERHEDARVQSASGARHEQKEPGS